MTRSWFVLLALTAALALGLRCPRLDERPMHNDEAVNAIKFGKLWEGGGYKYDPNEHHGPSLYYATLALGRLTAAPDFEHYSEGRLRAVTIVFGVALLLLLPLMRDGLGRAGTLWAGLFTAVSPAFVFYSRYFIHEMLLVFFTFLALAAGWRYWRTRRLGWILLAGAALGVMDATKETFAITLAAAGLAVVINQIWNRLFDASGLPVKAPPLNVWHMTGAALVWLVVALLLFSSFLANLTGPLDSLRSYAPWIQRAGGDSPHVHPWYFYLQRLVWFHAGKGPLWTEALVLVLAAVAVVAGFRRRRLGRAHPSLVRFLGLYAFILAAFYSAIGYKTPWCLLSFWHPAILLGGVGAAVVLRSLRPRLVRLVVAIVLFAGAGHLAWQSWQGNTEYAADPRNPYVYAQTSPDILELVNTVQALANASPRGLDTFIHVIAPEDDYWPLPWYLRQFKHVGWWSKMPDNPYAPLIVLSPRLPFAYDESRVHLMGFYGLRPQVPLALFAEKDLWQKWLSVQARQSAPRSTEQ